MSRTVAAALVLAALGACSDSGGGSGGGSSTTSSTVVRTAAEPLRVDLIDDAVAAVEAELGGPQAFYEINATPALVNLFVAGDGGSVTAFVYVAGVLTSDQLEGSPVGATFRADALDLDVETVTDAVAAELPTSRQDVFEIVGGPDGAVRYSIVVTSAAGGQLIVQVAGDGTILAVDPV